MQNMIDTLTKVEEALEGGSQVNRAFSALLDHMLAAHGDSLCLDCVRVMREHIVTKPQSRTFSPRSEVEK